MQLLPVLVTILLGGCALIFVLYPIYERMSQGVARGQGDRTQGGRRGEGDPSQGDRRGEGGGKPRPYYTRNANRDRNIARLAPALDISTNSQAEREQAARSALQEVELDFQLGNLSESDYRSLRERYLRRALLAMKSRHEREQELDEAIEEELRRLREMDETHQSIELNEL